MGWNYEFLTEICIDNWRRIKIKSCQKCLLVKTYEWHKKAARADLKFIFLKISSRFLDESFPDKVCPDKVSGSNLL